MLSGIFAVLPVGTLAGSIEAEPGRWRLWCPWLVRPLIHLGFSEQSLAPTLDGMVERRGRLRLVAISAGDRIELASAPMAKHREVYLSVGCSTRLIKTQAACLPCNTVGASFVIGCGTRVLITKEVPLTLL
jgi:hypothetical protein